VSEITLTLEKLLSILEDIEKLKIDDLKGREEKELVKLRNWEQSQLRKLLDIEIIVKGPLP
jgi:hypothetical protein